MKTIDELKSYYETTLCPQLADLEEERKGIVGKVFLVTWVVLGLLGFLLILIFSAPSSADTGSPWVFVVVGAFLIWFLIYYFLTKGYGRSYKARVIAKIVEFIDGNLHYQPEQGLTEDVFRATRIFTQTPDRYRCDDLVTGKVGETVLAFSEVHAEYKTETTDSKGNRRVEWHTIFWGLLFQADFNKAFKGTTVVLPDTAERLLGQLGKMLQSWNVMRGELIKLEDPEFEKLFVVYGDDQIEARYILSTSLMRRIVEFKQKTKRTIYLSFVRSQIFVAVAYNQNLFEPQVFKSLLDFRPIEEYFTHLSLAVGIVEDLNLNTRIWTKE